MKALITRKVGMTSTITEDGTVAAITLLSASDNVVTQLKNVEVDGYRAVQIGFEEDAKKAKPQLGHLKAAKMNAKIMREVRMNESDDSELKIGDHLSADLFSVGDVIDVTGTSKGKGGPVLSSDTTSTVSAKLMVVKVTLVRSVLLALCILRRSLKVRRWPVKWVTSK